MWYHTFFLGCYEVSMALNAKGCRGKKEKKKEKENDPCNRKTSFGSNQSLYTPPTMKLGMIESQRFLRCSEVDGNRRQNLLKK